ncbi:MAG: hypothetical protein K0Q87_3529, partial [Neobacillus sp.]|nr:hypothetical protein [Neobacillus sp.]
QKEYDKFSRDTTSTKFYHGKQWKLTRDTILDLDKLDVYVYMTTGEILIADTVHHIIPLKDEWDRRYDIDNLMSLSHNTHSMIESMYKVDKNGTIKTLTEMLRRYRNDISI